MHIQCLSDTIKYSCFLKHNTQCLSRILVCGCDCCFEMILLSSNITYSGLFRKLMSFVLTGSETLRRQFVDSLYAEFGGSGLNACISPEMSAYVHQKL